MSLLEILVRELPKLGGWPGDAVAISVSSNMAVCAHERMPNRIISGVWTDENEDTFGKYGRVFLLDESPDHREKPVTREQYEAAMTAKNDGWIDWGGGECPVSAGEMVDVIFGHGGRMSTNIADCWRCNHSGTNSDIIAYRLHKPVGQQLPTEETSIWNGEGLPPVGVNCEIIFEDDTPPKWYSFVATFIGSNHIVALVGMEELTYKKGDLLRPGVKFRAICSEATRKRDESIDFIAELCRSSASNGHSAELIYDAIAAGKIPHLKIA